MADDTSSIILEHLRQIRGTVSLIVDEVGQTNSRFGAIERLIGRHAVSEVQQSSDISSLKERVARIERHLALPEMP